VPNFHGLGSCDFLILMAVEMRSGSHGRQKGQLLMTLIAKQEQPTRETRFQKLRRKTLAFFVSVLKSMIVSFLLNLLKREWWWL
jgi:hypothetical protein